MDCLIPPGIGDAVWCMPKLSTISKRPGTGPIDLKVASWGLDPIETRAYDVLRRFDFIHSVEAYPMPKDGRHAPLLKPGPVATKAGHYNYIQDGPCSTLPGIDYVMIPNGALERGIRLEDWQPEIETDWGFMRSWSFTEQEKAIADQFMSFGGPFVVLYMCSQRGNTEAGHNRNGLWKPADWRALCDAIPLERQMGIVIVGAEYDASYYRDNCHSNLWCDAIGRWPICTSLAVIARAKAVIAYQSGIGVMAHYMGVPTAMWWRPKGNSIDPGEYVSPDEAMATAWTYPDTPESQFKPMIYGRETPAQIADWVAGLPARDEVRA